MVATADGGADAAEAIGEVCWFGQITTGAVAVGDPSSIRRAVDALRPHARVMLVTDHDDDVAAILLALRA
jgi:threonine dehydrogenase-like Zn-dependent dehydrogenase